MKLWNCSISHASVWYITQSWSQESLKLYIAIPIFTHAMTQLSYSALFKNKTIMIKKYTIWKYTYRRWLKVKAKLAIFGGSEFTRNVCIMYVFILPI